MNLSITLSSILMNIEQKLLMDLLKSVHVLLKLKRHIKCATYWRKKMTFQERRQGESLESMLRKFKRKIKNEGTLRELKQREYFEKPSEAKKKKLKAAQKRTADQQREQEL